MCLMLSTEGSSSRARRVGASSMANPIPKDSQAAKLARYRQYVADGLHLKGSLNFKSDRAMSLDLKLSTWAIASYNRKYNPEIISKRKKLSK